MAVGGPLFTVQEQVERIRAARHAATGADLPELLINARTDVFILGGDASSAAGAGTERGVIRLRCQQLAVLRKRSASSGLASWPSSNHELSAKWMRKVAKPRG
ncbi:isocitrate lyase/phosphoenolpyruvate mutase family protein [Streptomyces melanogenes]|uniref:isocitrate lyase/phosphoenolpyruvate mutase family protein n=1 Tax=Streptomyces melanogenes TaxID=67326 RepID=UPI0037B92291